MQKVTVNGRIGHVTSVLSTRNGKYPVWFEGEAKAEYVDAKNVVLIDSNLSHDDPAIRNHMPPINLDGDRLKSLKEVYDSAGTDKIVFN